MSSGSTCSPLSLLTLSYPIGVMSRRSRKWKRSSCEEVAVYSRTGTDTRPNEIVPDQIGRATGRDFHKRFRPKRRRCLSPDIRGENCLRAVPELHCLTGG